MSHLTIEPTEYTITKEPRGPLYLALVDHALSVCTSGLLVVRNDLGLERHAERCLQALAPFILATEAKPNWPGTELIGDTAKVLSFSFDGRSAEVLKSFSAGLYDWTQPNLPEDLCLFREDGRSWLVSIAHERDAFLLMSEAEFRSVVTDLGGLELETPGRRPTKSD